MTTEQAIESARSVLVRWDAARVPVGVVVRTLENLASGIDGEAGRRHYRSLLPMWKRTIASVALGPAFRSASGQAAEPRADDAGTRELRRRLAEEGGERTRR